MEIRRKMIEKIKQVQDKIIRFLREGNQKPLETLCKDNCSELSRLVAYWLRNETGNAKFFILKGNKTLIGQAHDVLAVSSDKVFIVDPTI